MLSYIANNALTYQAMNQEDSVEIEPHRIRGVLIYEKIYYETMVVCKIEGVATTLGLLNI